jgi:hypothetical protein
MNPAAWNLHQVPVDNTQRMQGAWPHAIVGPGNHLLFRGWGLAPQGGPRDGTHAQTRGPSRMFGIAGRGGLCQRGTWKSGLVFSTLEIFSQICPRKGLQIDLIGALRGR